MAFNEAIQLFINEVSLHEQFNTKNEFEMAIIKFINLIRKINLRIKNIKVYKSCYWVNYNALKGSSFLSSLNKISDKEIKGNFISIVFNKSNPINWQDYRIHCQEDLFKYKNVKVTDTSMAELAERKIQQESLICCLLNFIQSKFQNKQEIEIIKNEQISVQLDSIDNNDYLGSWIEKNISIKHLIYNIKSKNPPNDSQTILIDSERFSPTKYFSQGRRVYKELITDYCWYVDNLHCGKETHLEIFDKHSNHIGEATIQGVRIEDTKDPTKKIDLK